MGIKGEEEEEENNNNIDQIINKKNTHLGHTAHPQSIKKKIEKQHNSTQSLFIAKIQQMASLKWSVRRLKAEAFESYRTLLNSLEQQFVEDMTILKMGRFYSSEPKTLKAFQALLDCAGDEPQVSQLAARPADDDLNGLEAYKICLDVRAKEQAERQRWLGNRSKAEEKYLEELSLATAYSSYLLSVFPETSARATDILSRVRARVHDLRDPTSMDKPSSIMTAIEEGFSQGSSSGTHNISLWMNDLMSFKLRSDEKLPDPSELRKFLALLTRLEKDFDAVFLGGPCGKIDGISCTECGCERSRRTANVATMLITTCIGKTIPCMSSEPRMDILIAARNKICEKAPSDLTRNDITKFINDVDKFCGDLQAKRSKTPNDKPANRLDRPHTRPKGSTTNLPRTIEAWETQDCTPPSHSRFRHKAAACRVMLKQAKESGLLDQISGLRQHYQWYVTDGNSAPPRSENQESERGAKDSRSLKRKAHNNSPNGSREKKARLLGRSNSDIDSDDSADYLRTLTSETPIMSVRRLNTSIFLGDGTEIIDLTDSGDEAESTQQDDVTIAPPHQDPFISKGEDSESDFSDLDDDLIFEVEPLVDKEGNVKKSAFTLQRERKTGRRSRRVVIDTGCRQTTVNSDELLADIRPYQDQDPFVVTAGGHRLPISDQGTMELSVPGPIGSIKHRDCLVVPSCQENLLSLTNLLYTDPSICAILDADGVYLTKRDAEIQSLLDKVHRFAYLEEGSYYVEPSVLSKALPNVRATRRAGQIGGHKTTVAARSSQTSVRTTSESSKDEEVLYNYHRRFGHSDLRGLVDVILEETDLNKRQLQYLLTRPVECVICCMGKLRYEKPLATERPAIRLLQRVHCDSIPLPSPDYHGRTNCTLVVEEFSRFKYVFFTKHKNEEEIGNGVVDVLKRWSNLHKTSVLELRSDGGGEFVNATVNCYLRSIGAVSQISPAYTQALNGLAEANVGKLKDTARCMMLDANICIEFSSFALDYAAVLSNLHIHSFTSSRPYTVWNRRQPQISNYLPFGCLVVVYEPKDTRNRQGQKGMLGIFLGTIGDTLFRVFSLDAPQKIRHEKLIRPFPRRFPGLQRVGFSYKTVVDPRTFATRRPSPTTESSIRQKISQDWAAAEEPVTVQGEPAAATDPVLGHAETTDVRNVPLFTSEAINTAISNTTELKGSVSERNSSPELNEEVRESSERQDATVVTSDPDESALTTQELSTSVSEARHLESAPQNTETSLGLLAAEHDNPEMNDTGHVDPEDQPIAASEGVVADAGSNDEEDLIHVNLESEAALSNFVPDVEVRELRGGRWRATFVNRILTRPMSAIRDQFHVYCRSSRPSKRVNPLKDANLWSYVGLGTKPLRPDIKVLDSQPPPMSYSHVAFHEFKDHWISAMQAELSSLKDKDTWEEVDLPVGRKPVGLVWKFKYKNKGETIDKFKARLCVLGNTQTAGIDYDPENIFAPVMRGSTMRAALALFGPKGPRQMWITQADYTLAFLNASPKEDVYVKPPPGFPLKDPRKYMLLKRSLYGLCQSPREWYEYLRAWLFSQGFIESKSDPCLFTRERHGEDLEIILVYVDDTLIMASNRKTADAIKELMRSKFEMTDVEDADKVIGVEIFRVEGGVCLGQPTYSKMLLEEAGYWDISTAKLPENPMSEHWTHDDNSEELVGDEKRWFISFLMKIAWMSQQTRIDLAATASILAQYLTKPTKSDLAALRRCLLYLRGTYDDVLFFQDDRLGEMIIETNEDSAFHDTNDPGLMFAYADASFANEPGRRSRSGGCVLIRGAAIDWASKKQSMVALSSTEAEYYSVSQVTQSVLHFRKILRDLRIDVHGPTTIYEDNKSCIAIAYKPKHHGRTKHFDIKAHFIRDHVEKRDVEIIYCPTELMVADMLTKALPAVQHKRLKRHAGVRSLSQFKIVKLNQDARMKIKTVDCAADLTEI